MPRSPPGPRTPLGNQPDTVTSFGEREARVDLAVSVVAESYIGVYPLPVAGQVTIGRDPQAEFSIDHPSLSRRHATIEVGAAGLSISDLGSKNGTRVCDRPLADGEEGRLAIGDTILLGGVRLVVLAWGRRGKNPLFLGNTAFRSRIEYECARARLVRAPFAVVRLRVEGALGEDEVAALVARTFGPKHATTAVGAREFGAIVADPEPAAAALVAQLRDELVRRRATVRDAIATYPVDGQSPDALLLCTEQLLGDQTAKAGVGGRTVVVVDPSMVRLHALAKRVAAANVSVLLLGETGCGKEILAETIHAASSRKDAPFVRLNFAAFSENLLESELFGHEKGAYTGAVQAKPGLLEIAHEGTALLDEIGELPLPLQAKLLRFLEDGQIQRVGGLRPKQVDVRVIAATNRDLAREVQAGTFRADLYHRLNGFTLVIPPLRERPAEIAALAQQFLDDAAKEQRRSAVPRLSPEALARLLAHGWPGNVRELRNVVRAALIICGDEAELTGEHLPFQSPARVPSRPPRPLPVPPVSRPAAPAPPRTGHARAKSHAPYRDADEGERIAQALEQCGGNQAHAAQLLGISRTTLLKRMLAFGLRPPAGASPYGDPEERQRVVDALAACGGNRSRAAVMLGVSRSTLIMRMLAFGLHYPADLDG